MSIEAVREYLKQYGREGKIIEPDASTATVELAAQALGTEPARIAKTLSFHSGDAAMLVVTAGNAKIDNKKFKTRFGFKARMLTGDNVQALTGHQPGGVCPFALPQGVKVYLDDSLRRFDYVFPATGSPNSAIKLTPGELWELSQAEDWVDVTKTPEAEGTAGPGQDN